MDYGKGVRQRHNRSSGQDSWAALLSREGLFPSAVFLSESEMPPISLFCFIQYHNFIHTHTHTQKPLLLLSILYTDLLNAVLIFLRKKNICLDLISKGETKKEELKVLFLLICS